MIGLAARAASSRGVRRSLGHLRPLGIFGRQTPQDQANCQHRHGEHPGRRLVGKKRKLNREHDQERRKHEGPFPHPEAQFAIRARSAQIGCNGPDDADRIKVRQTAHVLYGHDQYDRNDRRHDQAEVRHAELVERLKSRRQFAVPGH